MAMGSFNQDKQSIALHLKQLMSGLKLDTVFTKFMTLQELQSFVLYIQAYALIFVRVQRTHLDLFFKNIVCSLYWLCHRAVVPNFYGLFLGCLIDFIYTNKCMYICIHTHTHIYMSILLSIPCTSPIESYNQRVSTLYSSMLFGCFGSFVFTEKLQNQYVDDHTK